VCQTADGLHYQYDNNGNMLNDSSGRSLDYTTFGKARSITLNNYTTSFSYAPDRTRYKRVDSESGSRTTTWYMGAVEKIEKPNGDTTTAELTGQALFERGPSNEQKSRHPSKC